MDTKNGSEREDMDGREIQKGHCNDTGKKERGIEIGWCQWKKKQEKNKTS